MYGGLGNDIFTIITGVDTTDVITDFTRNSSEIDKIDLSYFNHSFTNLNELNFMGGGIADGMSGAVINLVNNHSLTLYDVASSTLSDADFIFAQYDASSSYDVMVDSATNFYEGDGRSENITGTEDADEIYGGAGRDQLIGGLGADYLDGGYENDIILGGKGNDKIYGGLGVLIS